MVSRAQAREDRGLLLGGPRERAGWPQGAQLGTWTLPSGACLTGRPELHPTHWTGPHPGGEGWEAGS